MSIPDSPSISSAVASLRARYEALCADSTPDQLVGVSPDKAFEYGYLAAIRDLTEILRGE